MFIGAILGAKRGLDPVPAGEAGSHLVSRVHRMTLNRGPGTAALNARVVACGPGGMRARRSV
jgi:hypothetical protein